MAWQDRAANTFTGAASGAAAGSLIHPIAGVIGGVGGGILGLLQDTSHMDAARSMARGEIDPVAQQALSRALAREFKRLEQNVGYDLARRGLLESSPAATAMTRLKAAQTEALTSALAGQQFSRQQLGAQMLAQQQFGQSETISGAMTALTLARLLAKEPTQKPLISPTMDKIMDTGTGIGNDLALGPWRSGSTGIGGRREAFNWGGHRNNQNLFNPFNLG